MTFKRSASICVCILGLLGMVALHGCAGSPSQATPVDESSTVLATAAGMEITQAEVEEMVRGGLAKLRQDRYELLRQGVEQIVMEKMIETEAESRGITSDELIAMEIDDKVLEPTHQDIAAKYEENKARSGGKTLEQVYDMIQADIQTRRYQDRRFSFENMLKAKYDFSVGLEPPRTEIEVAADAPVRGSESAPITIIEFADYQCIHCKRVHPTIERLLMEYGEDTVRYIFQEYPLPGHIRVIPASAAARCAGDQDRFWQYFEHLMVMRGDLDDNDLTRRAQELGLDVAEFRACFDSGKYIETVESTIQNGQDYGITGTPTFFVNGIMMVGAKPYREFKTVIEEELRRTAATVENVGG